MCARKVRPKSAPKSAPESVPKSAPKSAPEKFVLDLRQLMLRATFRGRVQAVVPKLCGQHVGALYGQHSGKSALGKCAEECSEKCAQQSVLELPHDMLRSTEKRHHDSKLKLFSIGGPQQKRIFAWHVGSKS
jgi:hypothetical protein